MQTLDLKQQKRTWFNGRVIIVVVLAIGLSVAGMRAADNYLGQRDVRKAQENEGCPSDMVFIPSATGGFCLDKYEASAANDCPLQNPKTQSETRENLNADACRPVSAEKRLPWIFISQAQARTACAKAGKRLPTNKEWLAASLGTPDRAVGWSSEDCQVAQNWPEQPGLTGYASKCVSSFGVFDMIGNVWEWVDGTIVDGKYNGRELPEQGYVAGTDEDGLPTVTKIEAGDENFNQDFYWIKKSGDRAFARGGYWDNRADAGVYSVYLVSPSSFAGSGMGFRCAK